MFKTTLTVGLLCLLAGASAFAVAPPPRPLSAAALDRLIQQLGDRDYRLREQAERRLHSEGLAALPYLRKALGNRDVEIRRRAMRLLPGLEHAALVSPRRITLSISNKPLSVVLAGLGKASGYKVTSYGNVAVPPGGGEKTYSYRFLNTTFWEAVDQICRDADLVVQQGGDDTVQLYHGSGHAAHAGRDGAFRFSALNFQMYRSVDLSAINLRGGSPPARSENLTFSFNLFAEPRLPFLSMGEIRLEAAYDSERNSMLIKADPTEGMDVVKVRMGRRFGRRYYGGGYKQMSLQASINLHRPSEKASTLKLLKGVVPVTLLVEQKPVVLSDKILTAKDVKKTVGDFEFHIQNTTKQANNQIVIKLNITNKSNPNDWSWMNTLQQRLELLDDKGNKFQNWGGGWGGGGNNTVQMTLTFGFFGAGKAPTPAKFVFQNWVTRQHDIAFEFKDVPLP